MNKAPLPKRSLYKPAPKLELVKPSTLKQKAIATLNRAKPAAKKAAK